MDEQELLQQRIAIIRRIAELVPDSGKTSIQKTVYFLQEGLGVPLGYRFRMHYYGPYSEVLDSNLSLASGMGVVTVESDTQGDGYHVTPGPSSGAKLEPPMRQEKTDETIRSLGQLETSQLELLATMHFVRRLNSQLSENEVIRTVRRLKPKFSQDKVESAYQDVKTRGFLN